MTRNGKLDRRLAQLFAGEAQVMFGDGIPIPPGTASSVRSSDLQVPGRHGDIPIRLYEVPRVAVGPSRPAIVWVHGGGWAGGSIDEDDGLCRTLVRSTGRVVISVGYRLAPTHPFPEGLDDCDDALSWVVAHSGRLGIDSSRICLAGASAGGNLVAAVTNRRNRNGEPPNFERQILIVPALDLTWSSDSVEENAEGYLLTKEGLLGVVPVYLANPELVSDPEVSPLCEDARVLAQAPPTTIHVAEFDPLRDDGARYAKLLEGNGVEVELKHWRGQLHGSMALHALVPDVAESFFASIERSLSSGPQ